MVSAKSFLTSIGEHKDVFLILVIVVVLLMMIVPLPTVLMDFVIALNIGTSILIMLMVLQLTNPVHFTTFPSLLLVTTLFRLAISISTTRLILIDGDAGKIVETFGEVVVQGNLVVGLVIFLIITVVQFLVITKGADRVAEVGARFTLDGMPGKQMSVDADVRAGNIDQKQAKGSREILEQETKLFGAMDGAMKFVKGDAIAGLVITAINLIGGISIGMAQLGYTFGDALDLYALMTIGDGLVAQIPALLISVAAGTMVTRVTNPRGTDLATEIGQQVSANHRTMILAGIVIAGFGLIPGFPTVMFMILGLGMSLIVYLKFRRDSKPADVTHDWIKLTERNRKICDEYSQDSGLAPTISVALPRAMLRESSHDFYEKFVQTMMDVEERQGAAMGVWAFDFHSDEEEYVIRAKGEVIHKERVRPGLLFVKSNVSYLSALSIPHEHHFGASEGALVSDEYREKLDKENIPYSTITDQIVCKIFEVVRENLGFFVGLQSTSDLLDSLVYSNQTLVSDLKSNLSVHQVSAVLKLLVEEQIPMNQPIRILEAILEWGPKRPDPQLVLQQVRLAIGDLITRLFSKDNFLTVVAVGPTLESHLRDAIRSSDDKQFLVLDAELSQNIVKQARAKLSEKFERGVDPVIITQQDVRRAMFNILHKNGLFVPVLSYQEVTANTVLYPVGFIDTGMNT